MRPATDNPDDETIEETLSGLGIWTGLMPVADDVQDEHDVDVSKSALVERIDRLFERYRWFVDRIDTPRSTRRCTRILKQTPREPGAWERALVELSLLGTDEARVFLQTWEPPADPEENLELELFRRICIAKCDA